MHVGHSYSFSVCIGPLCMHCATCDIASLHDAPISKTRRFPARMLTLSLPSLSTGQCVSFIFLMMYYDSRVGFTSASKHCASRASTSREHFALLDSISSQQRIDAHAFTVLELSFQNRKYSFGTLYMKLVIRSQHSPRHPRCVLIDNR